MQRESHDQHSMFWQLLFILFGCNIKCKGGGVDVMREVNRDHAMKDLVLHADEFRFFFPESSGEPVKGLNRGLIWLN